MKYVDDIIGVVSKYGNKVIKVFAKHGDKVFKWAAKYGDEVIAWLTKQGNKVADLTDDVLEKVFGKKAKKELGEESRERGVKETTSKDSLKESGGKKQKRNNEDVERDKVAEEDLPGGHKVKVTDDGTPYVCSKCDKPDLTSEQQAKVDQASTPEEKAKIVKQQVDTQSHNSSEVITAPSRMLPAPAKDPRNSPGTAQVSSELPELKNMMRGSHGNIGLIGEDVAEQMKGKQFKSFDDFREQFWIALSETKHANEFSKNNRKRMEKGLAPKVSKTQHVGKRSSYELHHRQPIHTGGEVYDLSNLLVTTPRMHQEILDPNIHYKRKNKK